MHSPSIALESASDAASASLWFDLMERAERAHGWAALCRDLNVYAAWSEELIAALSSVLSRCKRATLEIGSGGGELARELCKRGIPVHPTDPCPAARDVMPLNARNALEAYRPVQVLSSFLPVDAGIEAEVLRFPTVRHYLYIGPIILGRLGPDALWSVPGWQPTFLPEVDNALITRLDVLPDFTRGTHQRGAGAVLMERVH